METTATATATAAPAAKTPPEETDPENPTRIHPGKPISFTNGVLKLRHLPHAPPSPGGGAYRECLKNHAAAMGGHAVDGCGEFFPSAAATPSDPTSLRCAACGCHRNFHRRDPSAAESQIADYHPVHRHHPPPPPPRSPNSPSPPPISSTYYPSAPHMLLALSSNPNPNPSPSSSARKRFRTRFTQIQREKMYEFAEKLGWKMQRRDEDAINGFCNGIGVEKGVFKVWMHNNKNTLGKKDLTSSGANVNGNGNGNGNGIGIGINLDNTPLSNNNNYRNSHSDEVSVNPVGTNASSSSS